MRALLAVAGLAGCVSTAVSDGPLSPGLWEISNRPGTASLDGRVLNELPLPPQRPERVCLSAAQAADPASFLAGTSGAECKTSKAALAGGKVRIEASCANPDGGRDGTMLLTGRYGGQSYKIDFATTAYGDNGTMRFSGKLAGRRIGDCPAA